MKKKKQLAEGEGEDWEPRYGNDSRPWLLGFSKDEPASTSTTTKDTFTADWPDKPRAEGKQPGDKEGWRGIVDLSGSIL